MRLKLDVQRVAEGDGLPDKPAILRWARAALADVAAGEVELGVRIVDEDESAALNTRYRGKSGPTNVLSFSYAEPPFTGGFLGDLVICAPVVAREAVVQGKTAEAHWAHMVVHGIMHLRGYDHLEPGEAAVMEGLEADIMERLGFADPYSD